MMPNETPYRSCNCLVCRTTRYAANRSQRAMKDPPTWACSWWVALGRSETRYYKRLAHRQHRRRWRELFRRTGYDGPVTIKTPCLW